MSHIPPIPPAARGARDWFLALRPWSFPASAMPVLLSLAYFYQAGPTPDAAHGALALASVLLIHAAGNLWSDVFDYRSGVDAHDTEGVRVLALGRFSVAEYLGLAALLAAAGSALCGVLAARLGSDLLLAGAAGLAAGLLYPPLKYRAWGDAVIFAAYTVTPLLAMGRIVTGEWTLSAWPALLPAGVLTVAILMANNLRDMETDARAGIQTLAIALGARRAKTLLKAEYALSFALALSAVVAGALPVTALAVLGALVPLAKLLKTLDAPEARYARLDEATAALQLVFSLLMVIGLAAARLLPG